MDCEQMWAAIRRDHVYKTAQRARAPFAVSLRYHLGVLGVILRLYRDTWSGPVDRAIWARHQIGILAVIEACGGMVEVSGIENLAAARHPCVIVANHMSAVETLLLPLFVQAFSDVTLVVKTDLLRYPIFGRILRVIGIIPVDRRHPREDLKQVIGRGGEFIAAGCSVLVFPQATRSLVFDPAQFNSIGVKLARHAQCPVVPAALKSDFLHPGRIFKDFGAVDPSRTIHMRFGPPMTHDLNPRETHERVVAFIRACLLEWGGAVR